MSRRTGLILCLLTAALFFGDALVGDRTVVPAGFLYRHAPWTDVNLETIQDPAQQLDQIYQFYPWAHYFKESVWKGEFPLWNPFNYLGTPFFANPQTALLFPLTWLHLIFPLSLSFTLIFISKLALGLVGMYLWLNAIGLRPVSSLLGAAVYTLSMHTVAGIAFPYSTVEVLFPWVLLAAKALCRGGTDEVRSGQGQAGSKVRQPSGLSLPECPETSWKLVVRQPSGLSLSSCPETSWKLAVRQPSGLSLARWQGQAGSLSYVLFVLVVSVVALAGQPQSVLPVCSAALLLAGLITRPLRVRPVLLMGSGFLLALLVTSAQWLATLGYLRESMVASGPRVIRSGYPYTLDTLVSLMVPNFFGSPIQGNYWGFPGYQDSIFYSSIAGFVLAVLGLWLGRRRAHLQYLFPLLLLLIGAGVIFAIPGIESLLDLPVFQLAKRNKFVFLGIFAIAQLAAIGIEELQREERRLPALTFGMAAVMPVSAAFLFWHYSEFLSQLDPAGIAVRNGLICLGLLAATVVILLFVPGRWRAGLLVTLVLVDLSFFSWGLNPRGSREALYPQPEINQLLVGERPRIYGFQGAYTPNSNQVFGLQDVRGYDVMTPTRLFRYMQKIDPSLGNAYKWLMGFDPDEIGLNTRMRQIIGEFLENAKPEVIEYLETSSYWSVSAAQVRNPALFDLLHIRYLLTA
ncbi:MAG: hypothetical protein JSU96_03755, partial [Acidobacteriota bacterium]